jgi:AcrR family transcriptional regulator
MRWEHGYRQTREGFDAVARPGQPNTKDLIQQVALELFIERGFSATSLQQIADKVGVTKAALYYYFPSKDDLARSIFLPWKTDLDSLLDEAEAAESLPPRELIERAFDVLLEHRGAFTATMRDGSILKHIDLVAWTGEWARRFQTLLVGPNPTVSQRVRVAVAVGGLNDAIFLLGEFPVEEVRPAAIEATCAAMGLEVTWDGRERTGTATAGASETERD